MTTPTRGLSGGLQWEAPRTIDRGCLAKCTAINESKGSGAAFQVVNGAGPAAHWPLLPWLGFCRRELPQCCRSDRCWVLGPGPARAGAGPEIRHRRNLHGRRKVGPRLFQIDALFGCQRLYRLRASRHGRASRGRWCRAFFTFL